MNTRALLMARVNRDPKPAHKHLRGLVVNKPSVVLVAALEIPSQELPAAPEAPLQVEVSAPLQVEVSAQEETPAEAQETSLEAPSVEAPQEAPSVETPQEAPSVEAPSVEAPSVEVSPLETFLMKGQTEIIPEITQGAWDSQLTELLSLEKAGRARKKVLSAIEARKTPQG